MEPHKRYLLFEFDCYYPGGGMSDLTETFDNLQDAIKAAKESMSDAAQIYDRIAGVIIDY